AAATATTAPPKATPAATPSPKPAALKKLRIITSYSSPKNIAPYVAQKEGYFKEEGLDVEFTKVPGTAGLAALAAGEVLLSDGSSSSINAAFEGAPFKVVYPSGNISQWIWARDPIKKIEDLVGKKFACSSPNDSMCLAAKSVLKKKGLANPEKDITYIGIGSTSDRHAALKSGAVDAGYQGGEHWQLVPLEGKGYTMLVAMQDVITMLGGGYATSNRVIQTDRDTLKATLRAMVKGSRLFFANKEKGLAYLKEWNPGMAEYNLQYYEYETTKGLFKDGLMPVEAQQQTIDIQKQSLGFTGSFTVQQGFDMSFLQEIVKELDAKGWKP
ncbi:MAG: ABC transporter substrate-binding protein, partial [Dehalococcoidia bacterium]|nr:ABC transporter substrate-binding protein [Dehalococcoidia bacterium]